MPFRCRLGHLHHVSSSLVECPRNRFDEQVVLALEMPVEAPFLQAHLFHYCTDAAGVPAALAERASGHGKNLLVVLRFVFKGVPHDRKSTSVLQCLSSSNNLCFCESFRLHL